MQKHTNFKPILLDIRFYLTLFLAVYFVLLIHHYNYDGWINPDTGHYVNGARNFIFHQAFVLDDFNFYYLIPLFSWLTVLVFKIFGIGIFQSKILALTSILLCAVIIYKISERITKEKKVAFFATFLFCFCPNIFVAAKCGQSEPLYFLFFLISVYLSIDLHHECPKTKIVLVCSGIFFGMALLVKAVALKNIIIVIWVLLAGNETNTLKKKAIQKLCPFFIGFGLIVVGWYSYIWFNDQLEIYLFNLNFFATSESKSHLIRTLFINPIRSLYSPMFAFFRKESQGGLIFPPLFALYIILHFSKSCDGITLAKFKKAIGTVTELNWVSFCICFIILGIIPLFFVNVVAGRQSLIILFPICLFIAMTTIKDFSRYTILSFLETTFNNNSTSKPIGFITTFIALIPIFPMIMSLAIKQNDFQKVFVGTLFLLVLHLFICTLICFNKDRIIPKINICCAFATLLFTTTICISEMNIGYKLSMLPNILLLNSSIYQRIVFWVTVYLTLFFIVFIAILIALKLSRLKMILSVNFGKFLMVVIIIIYSLQFVEYYLNREKINYADYKNNLPQIADILEPDDVVVCCNTSYFAMLSKSHIVEKYSPSFYSAPAPEYKWKTERFSPHVIVKQLKSYLLWIYNSSIMKSTYADDTSIWKNVNANFVKRFKPRYLLVRQHDKKLLVEEKSNLLKEEQLKLVYSFGDRDRYGLYEILYN